MLNTRFPIGPMVAVLALGALDAACGGNSGGGDVSAVECEPEQTDDPLRLFNWTEYIEEEQVAEFAEQYGIDYSIDAFESNESMQAIVAAGNSNFDLVVPSDYMVGIMIAGGHLLPLDQDALPNLSNISDQFLDPAFDEGLAHSVPYQWGYTGIAVNEAVVGDDYPRSWSLIFGPEAEEFSGQISVLNDARETLGAALKYLGYSINTTDQAELDEASALLAEAKANILAFETDSAEDFLINGETVIAHTDSGDIFTSLLEVDNPDDYVFFVPEEGSIRWTDNFAIPFDAPHPCTAHTFINWMLQGEQHARLTNWNAYGSPNDASIEFLNPGIADAVSLGRLAGPPGLIEGLVDTGDFEIEYSDAFVRAKG